MDVSGGDKNLLTFGGHLEVLRRMLIRMACATGALSVIVFCFKGVVWRLLLAPSEWNFATYRFIERLAHAVGFTDFRFSEYHVDLIATDLSSQFMTHIATALQLGMLAASPYILFELFRFVAPALYDNERRYSVPVLLAVYLLFLAGVAVSYFVLFPISFRFLGTYSVSERIHSAITLNSYISTFTTLTIVMGAVFQLPVLVFILTKAGFVNAAMLSQYRKHSFIVILLVAAIITPPDVLTLLVVALPLYLLFEASIRVAAWSAKRSRESL